MAPRLPKPLGAFIQRDKPVEFEFEGKRVHGFQGDTIASALVAEGHWLLSRSFKYHRPRGPLSMAGQDANTLVQVRSNSGVEVPNTLADKTEIHPGMNVQGQNYSGSLRTDRMALLNGLGRFLKVGFYYRALFKPKGAWRLWEPIIRRSAGLGSLSLANDHAAKPDKCYGFYDIAVIGAGPAGMQAALTAAQAGVKVLLVDEWTKLGGSLIYHGCCGVTQQQAICAAWEEQIRNEPNIETWLGATCTGWLSDNYLAIMHREKLHKVRVRECIFSCGGYEQQLVFRHNDLPGVVLCSAALRLIYGYAVSPGRRAVVLTVNNSGYDCATALVNAGTEVLAIVDLREQVPEDMRGKMQADSIPIISHSTVFSAQAHRQHLYCVEVRKLIDEGAVGREKQMIYCDLLCISGGVMPAWQLPCLAGAKFEYSDDRQQFELRGTPAHVHLAGTCNSQHQYNNLLDDGRRAAQAALANLGHNTVELPLAEPEGGMNHPWPIIAHPKGKEFVDFDEDLHIRDILDTVDLGYRDIQLVKRYSTLGMGPSQGRHSALAAARLVAKANGVSVAETGVTTARPPAQNEPLLALAGRRMLPFKRTPMHALHIEHGAQMMPAGLWQRPAYYGPATEARACIEAEVQQVRTGVGMIDLSTLGGIDLRGPDAVEFLNRMYTFGFAKQGVGKLRYTLMCNTHGTVIDDGVACRLGEQHFYITATTTGVDQVYRQMTYWNQQWRLQVDIANVTSAFAAINIAGPKARKVLQRLLPNDDLSQANFPYLAGKTLDLLGVSARILRVGFVGELGYEVHVPSHFGHALWLALAEAGKPDNIKPYGVQAQRLLRLEKGHVIIGQDTDGMSYPQELAMGWAVSGKKPFFIGKRSLEIITQQTARRALVGFTLPADHRNTKQPKEGHLVLSEGQISGNVTSCEYSPTLNKIVGLAYVSIHQQTPGTHIPIRIDRGQIVSALVADLPFYDPDNLRQTHSEPI